MTDYQLKNIDPEDIEDLILKIETSFDISFEGDELVPLKTFGQLCDHITYKIQLKDADDCTSQQAFYKLRNAITSTLLIDRKNISINHSLAELLPRNTRRSKLKGLEKHLGFKLNILRPPHWVTILLLILAIASIVCFFINWQIGLLSISISITGFWLAKKLGIELDLKTVGQVAEKMTRENYVKSRRNQKTFNKNEIENLLREWFSNEFGLDKGKLNRDATFG